MKTSHLAAKPKLRILLLAAVGLLAAGLLAAAATPASAGSGGVGITEQSGKDTSGSTSRHKARYRRLWKRVSRRDRRWARRTSQCESGRDPKAIGGGGRYRGAFQFTRPTWRRAPKSPGGDPIRFNYKTQAVVAVALKRRDGRGHWPTCG